MATLAAVAALVPAGAGATGGGGAGAVPRVSAARGVTVTELPPLEGLVRPYAINDRGQVVAYTELPDEPVRAVWLYDDGRWREVSPPAPDRQHETDPSHEAWQNDLSERGDVGGHVDIISLVEGYHIERGFVWMDGRLVEIDAGLPDVPSVRDVNERRQVLFDDRVWHNGRVTVAPAPPVGKVTFTAINNRGVAVGRITTSPPDVFPRETAAVIWRVGGDLRPLGSLPGLERSEALAISDAGVVAGWSHDADSRAWRSWVWRDGRMTDLGTLGGSNTYVGLGPEDGHRPPNARGEVAGQSETASGDLHAFLWTRGRMVDLGPGGATTVNDHGQVLGDAGRRQGVVWQNGRMLELSSLLGTDLPVRVYDMNNRGQVLGRIVDPEAPGGGRIVVVTVPPSWGAGRG